MILKNFEHHGSIAFPDHISVPFDQLPGILGVCGPTGAGKTSLLELLCAARYGTTAYRDMPLPDQFVRAGKVETVFDDGDVTYRTVLTVDPKAGRAEGMLFRGNQHIAGPLIRDYRRQAVEEFGPMDLFLATAYAVQPKYHGKDTSGSFLRADKSDRRAIFAEMFGLKSFERHRAVAKDRADALMQETRELRARVTELEIQIARRAELEEQRRVLTARLAEAEATLERSEAAAHDAITAKGDVVTKIAGVEAQRGEADQLRRDLRALDDRVVDMGERLRNNRKLLERGDEIRDAVTRDAALNKEHGALQALKPEAEELDRRIVDLTRRLRETESRLHEAQAVMARETEIRGAVASDRALEIEQAGLEPVVATAESVGMRLDGLKRLITESRDRRAALEDLLGQADAIAEAVTDLAACDARISELTEAIETAEAERETAQHDYFNVKNERAGARLELTSAQKDAVRLRTNTATLDTVPCHGDGPYAGCPFLVDARAASNNLPPLDAEIARLEALVAGDEPTPPADTAGPLREERTRLQTERPRLQAVADKQARLDTARERMTELDQQIPATERETEHVTAELRTIENSRRRLVEIRTLRKELAPLTAQQAALETADAVIDELRDTIADLTMQGSTASARRDVLAAQLPRLDLIDRERAALADTLRFAAHLESAQTRIDELEASLETTANERMEKTGRLGQITTALAELPGLEEKRLDLQRAENAAVEARRQANQSVAAITRESGVLDGQIDAINTAEERVRAAQTDLTPKLDDMADWSLLSKAFSPAGIPALKIDVELPDISQKANELLRECFGENLFSISLVTQKLAADDSKLLETLDVVILREGRPIPAEALSGGEGALLSECLSLAMALNNAERSGRQIGTIMRDEVSSPLDTSRCPSYTRMLRRVAALGHFRHVLFISHQEAALELADARLEVGGGRIVVR